MIPSQNCLHLIGAFEANKFVAYRCPAGVWTIGRGHTSAAGEPHVYPGLTISAAQSDNIFAADVGAFAQGVDALGLKLDQDKFDALVSLAFNIGAGALAKSSIVRLIRKGDTLNAGRAFLAWNRATVGGEKIAVAGLTRRRKAEKALFEGDADVALLLATGHKGPMPQAVDAPAKAKNLDTSPTTVSGLAAGTGGVIVVGSQIADQVQQATDTLGKAKDAARGVSALATGVPSMWLLLAGLAIVIAAAVILWRRIGYWRNADKIETETVELASSVESDVEEDAHDLVADIDPVNQGALGLSELFARANSARAARAGGAVPLGAAPGSGAGEGGA